MSHDDLQDAIAVYANAYHRLQRLQDSLPWIPGGDQKTGCIGEYYAYAYLLSRFDAKKLSFGSHSEKGWDILVEEAPPCRIQVKTVSAFSKTRTLSPIHEGWDQLFIVYLNRRLEPEGFWIIEDTGILEQEGRFAGAKCKQPGNDRSGSGVIPFGPNRITEMVDAIESLSSAQQRAPADGSSASRFRRG